MQITIRRTLKRIMKPALLASAIATTCLQPAMAQDSGATDPSKPAVPPLPEVLITDGSQLHSNAHNLTNDPGAGDDDLAKLISEDNNTSEYDYWISDTEGNCKEPQYLQVDLGEGFQLGADYDIVVCLGRHKSGAGPDPLHIENFGKKLHPTAFHVEVSADGETWEPFADPDTHVYFTYRGPMTKEFSTRIHTDKTFRYIRFTVTANNSKTLNKGTQHRSMCLSHFQLLKVKKDSGAIYFFNTEPGKEIYLTDRFHLNTDLRPDYADYEFVNTRGIFDLRKLDHYNTADNPKDFCDWDACWDENGIWKKDLLTLAKYGIDMPKYSWITGTEDPLVKKGNRQRTHVIEHTYYAVPGDAVALVPYYEMPTRLPDKYDVSYAHWYDYETGGHIVEPRTGARLLDFLVNPRDIYISKNHGYFAGIGFPRESHYSPADASQGVSTMDIASVDDFLNFVNEVNDNNKKTINARLTADLDFTGHTWSSDAFPKIEDYAGTFDGQGHVIKNLHYQGNGTVAFIQSISNRWRDNVEYIGCLKNVIFDESCSFEATGEYAISAIVGKTNCGWRQDNAEPRAFTIKGVINKGVMSATNTGNNGNAPKASGLLGVYDNTNLSVKIISCASTGNINVTSSKPDPQVAQLTLDARNTQITDCWSFAKSSVEVIASGGEIREIATADDLIQFANDSKNNSRLSAKLTADIDMAGKVFPGIGNKNNDYVGTIDGQGHVISNLNYSGEGTVAFIYRIGVDQTAGTLKDIVFDKTCSFKSEGPTAVTAIIGSIGYQYNSTSPVVIEGVINKASMTAKSTNQWHGYAKVSGLIGICENNNHAPVEILKCAVTGAINLESTREESKGAQLALDASNMAITDCWSVAKVNLTNETGEVPAQLYLNANGETSVINTYSIYGAESGEGILQTDENLNTPAFVEKLNLGKGPEYSAQWAVSTETGNGSGAYPYPYVQFKEEVAAETPAPLYLKPNDNTIIQNTYSIYGEESGTGVLQSPLTAEDLNSAEWVSKLNDGKEGYWAVSTADGDGAGAFPYPYAMTAMPSGGTVVRDDAPGKWVWADNNGKNIYSNNPGPFYKQRPDAFYDQKDSKGSGNAGTYATFFYPRDPYAEDGSQLGLPQEYTIAADFSYSFNVVDPSSNGSEPQMDATLNIDYEHRKIYEPELCYRHIFHIKDGRKFAEEMSGSYENNQKYVAKTRRYITSLAGKSFSVRLDAGMPMVNSGDEWDARSRFYYKISDTDYRRVAGCKVVTKKLVTKADGTEVEENCDGLFQLGSSTMLVGSRTLDGVNDSPRYYACGGNLQVYRMLTNEYTTPSVGKYVVRLVAQDVNGNTIHPFDPENPDNPNGDEAHDLIVREFVLEFVDPQTSQSAYICDEDELTTKYVGTEADLTERFGAAYSTVDCDEYIAFNKMIGEATDFPVSDYIFHPWKNRFNYQEDQTNGQKYYALKWPLPRHDCEYGSTLGRGHNYCTYRVAQHSSVVEWKGNVMNRSADKNFNVDTGLFDRHFYESGYQIRLAKEEAAAKGEEYTGPEEPEPGYFYWVNASSDPGVMNRLNVGKLCHGATLHISAWVALFNGGEQANISFNFVAVMKDGSRVRLHSFVTGEISTGAGWHKVYYNITPEIHSYDIDASQINHYEIELDNNADESEGADYAVDKVQVYIMQADVKAKQLTFPCDDQEKVTDMKVYIPFNNMLRMVDMDPAKTDGEAQQVNLYYSFVNRALYDKCIADGMTTDQAYNATVLKGCYGTDHENPDPNATYGHMKFTTRFSDLQEYVENVYGTPMGQTEKATKTDFFTFNCWVKDQNLRVGNEYYILLFNDPEGLADRVPTAADYDIDNECAAKCLIEIEGTSKLKVDGYAYGNDTSLECCEHDSPVIQLDMVGYHVGNRPSGMDYPVVIQNAAFDWYLGQLSRFYLESTVDKDGNTILLSDALAKFRASYPDASSAIQECTGQYTEPLRDYLVSVTTTRDGVAPKLYLHQHSFVFPDTSIPEGQSEAEYYVSAIPCDYEGNAKMLVDGVLVDAEDIIVCPQPVEIKANVSKHSPRMKGGLTEITDYPEYLNDVPLRTGLTQIRKASATKADSKSAQYTLDFPIRFVKSTSNAIGQMVINTDKDEVLLTETNDPEYKGLHPEPSPEDLADGTLYPEDNGLWAVGRLVSLKANISTDNSVKDNIARIVFYKNDPADTETKAINFKEGYYYRFAVPYMEEVLEGVDYVPACPGRQIVTLKIVPEYMRWDADGSSLNWNNDMYWERVDAAGLYADAADKAALNDFVTDGANNRIRSYSPAPFTKVIIPAESFTMTGADGKPAGIEDPYLYKTEDRVIDVYTRAGNKSMTWTTDPEDKTADSPAGLSGNLLELLKKAVTFDINYDMVAFDGETFLGCGPWRAHICDQIDFMPRAGISNQQYLTYNKAWVEFEMTPGRWYTLSSPLAETLAGDMYMPTANSRQETLRFSDITYDPKLNNRFAPAVFQRNWDAANATLYKLPSADFGNGEQINVAIETNWSHVFNDVMEEYRPGEGFSIYTDTGKVTAQPEKVLMRLPKADTEWYYYDIDWTGADNDNTTSGIHGDKTAVTRTDANYRLNSLQDDEWGTMTGIAAGNSPYYLFGNPFMTRLDMARLLEANKDKIKSVYWVMADNSVEAAAVVGQHVYSNSMTSADALVSPLQGFFVELNGGSAPGGMLQLRYNNSMMARTAAGGNPIRKPGTRSGSDSEARGLILEALRNDTVLSRSLIVTDPEATPGYGDEDAPLMVDRQLVTAPLVYSLAGQQATLVNVTDDIDGVGIGLINDDDNDKTVIRLGNVAEAEDCMLLDLATGDSQPIYEGMEIPVTGSSNGRYYITRGGAQDNIRAIRIERSGNTVTVTTGRQNISVDVFDTLGVHTASHQADAPQVSFTLPAGVYVLKADDGTERKTAKLIIR